MWISEPNLGVCRFKLLERLDLHLVRSVWPLPSRIVFVTQVTSENNIPKKSGVFSFMLTFTEVKEEEGRVPVYMSKGVGDGRNSILEAKLLVLSKLLWE